MARPLARLAAVALAASALAAPLSAQDAPAPRFAPSTGGIELADRTLTVQERQFVEAHPELRVAVNPVEAGDYPPYVEVSSDGEYGGYVIDLLGAAADAIGFRLVPVVLPDWSATLEALRAREVDLALLAAYDPEREDYLDYVPGVFPDPIGLIARAGRTRFDADEMLEGVRVGVSRGFVEEGMLATLYPRAVPVPVTGLPGAIEALANDEVELYLGPILPVVTLAERRGDLPLRVVRRVYGGSGGTQMVARSDRPMIARLLGRFIGDGRGRVVEEVIDGLDTLSTEPLAPLSLSADEAARLARHETLRVGALASMPTLNGVTADGAHTGIAADFTAYLAYEFSLPVEVVPYADFADLLDGAGRGEIDLIPLLSPAPDGGRGFVFSRPYFETPWVMIGHQAEGHVDDLGRFAGGRVGLVRGNPLRAALGREHPDIEFVDYRQQRDLLQAVVRHDIDAAVMTRQAALPLLNLAFAGELHVLGPLGDHRAPFSFAVPPDEAELMPLIDRALEQMDPALAARIVRRWTAVDFEPARRLTRLVRLLVPGAALLGLLSLAVLWWNRRIAAESRRRRLAEQRLVDMTEGLRTGVFQLHQRGGETPRFVFSNALARQMVRVPEGEIIDSPQRLFAHVPAGERERVGERMKHSLRTGEPFREAFRFAFPWNPDGWVLAEATPRREADGTVLWNGHLFDLSGERALSENLEASLLAKEEFIATAGHELRAPAQNVALALEALERADGEAVRSERLRVARRASDDLQEMLGDLLDLSRMDARALTLREEPVRLHEMVESVLRAFDAAAERKGLTVECRIEADVPALVRADPLRLRQILFNLLGNAVKYTDEGGVSLRVHARPASARTDAVDGADGANGGEDAHGTYVPAEAPGEDLVFEVHDTGIGIPAAQLGRIFEPFSTVGPVSRRSTGLGLAICHRLVAVMKGRIEVESEPGAGSTFRVRLPLERLEERSAPHARRPGQATPAAEPPPAAVAGGRVLLVDDDRFVRVTLAALLRGAGFEVEEAEDGEAALARLDRSAFVAVVTDQRMPGMSGLELARAIRRRAAHRRDGAAPEPPVIVATTGGMSVADAGEANEAFDAVLVKPVSAAQIRHAIAVARSARRSDRSAAA